MGLADKYLEWSYQSIYNKAMNQCKKVSAAKTKCEEARYNLKSFADGLSSDWQGDAATAFYEAISEIYSSMDGIVSELGVIYETMAIQAGLVSSEWPDLVASQMEPREDPE